ncbi:MAG: GNAT family N-acetyltransferase [Anaerolineaceae bacterium]|nr:GNAT family N-acetyltransferase [Anaerolineaceae bacterium]
MDFEIQTSFIEELETEWNELLGRTASHAPFLRYEYLSAWWETRGGGEWPQESQLILITARRDGRLAGAAPLFYVKDHHGKPALLLVGSIEVSDFLDLMAAPGDIAAFCRELLAFLPAAGLPHWETLDLYNILDTSPTLPALQTAAKEAGWGCEQEKLQHSPYIPLPGDWETYLAGIDKKQRHEIRRKIRRAEESEKPVTWYLVQDGNTLEEETDALMKLMAFEEDKAAFLTEPIRRHFHNVVRCAFERDCLHLAFLTIGGEKAAGYFGFNYLNRLWIYNSGMDPAFRDYSPGWVLLGYQLRWANEAGFTEFDFMRGDEEYKYRFGALDRFVVRAALTPPVAALE